MKKKLFIGTAIFILIILNPLLSYTLTRWGNCKTKYIQDSKIKLLTECEAQTESLMKNVLHAQAFVVGKNIFTYKETLSEETMSHELAHVYQYRKLGPLFLPLYGIAHLAATIDSKITGYTNIHAGNIFEVWANKIANLPPEEKY